MIRDRDQRIKGEARREIVQRWTGFVREKISRVWENSKGMRGCLEFRGK